MKKENFKIHYYLQRTLIETLHNFFPTKLSPHNFQKGELKFIKCKLIYHSYNHSYIHSYNSYNHFFNLLVSFLKLLEIGIWDDFSWYMYRILPKDVPEAAICKCSSSSLSPVPLPPFRITFGIELTPQLDQGSFSGNCCSLNSFSYSINNSLFFVCLFVEPYHSEGIILRTTVKWVETMFKFLTFMKLTFKLVKKIINLF